MSIVFNEQTQQFYITTRNTCYTFGIVYNKYPEHLYYGKRIGQEDLGYIENRDFVSFAPYKKEIGPGFSFDTILRESSVFNGGDFRTASLVVRDQTGHYGLEPEYLGHTICEGREEIPGMPCGRSGDGVSALNVTLYDKNRRIEVILHYVCYFHSDVIGRYVEIRNLSDRPIRLEKCSSLLLDLYGDDLEFLDLAGCYCNERHLIQRTGVRYGRIVSSSQRGVTGHGGNPFFALTRNCDEYTGEAYGFNLIYSGNYCNECEVDPLGNTRVVCGIEPTGFHAEVGPGGSFFSPEAVMTYSDAGLSAMSHRFHDFVRRHILPPDVPADTRPIVFNSWEASYFGINEQTLFDFADRAKQLGVDLIVLDDGWFRDSDRGGLGDWKTDAGKFPSGFKAIAAKLQAKGLRFGLWIEPEMLTSDSEIYRQKPYFALHNGSAISLSRHQMVMDLSNEEVVDYLFDTLCAIVEGTGISYIKWDMNRYLSEAGNDLYDQGEVWHRYILGLYALLRRFRARFPEIAIEHCAGGGGRFDLGMLYYAAQIWTSDNTDPRCRMRIQYGTSLAYPCSVVSCHVTDRHGGPDSAKALEFACAVASFGSFGYEFDVKRLSRAEVRQLCAYSRLYKEREGLIHAGDLYRLLAPDDGAVCYMHVSRDRSRALFTYIQSEGSDRRHRRVVRLKGLDEDRRYKDTETGDVYSGRVLMCVGMVVPNTFDGGRFALQKELAAVPEAEP